VTVRPYGQGVVARPVAPDCAAPRRDSRRAEILAAFTRAVAERGYDGTNFGDLAVELGISKGTIVHHFGTKDAMLRELHEGYMRRRLAEVRIIWGRLARPAERLAAFVQLGVHYQVVDRTATIAFQREVRRFAATPGMETSQALRHEYRELVVGVLAEGTAAGEFRPGDDRLRTLQLFGAVHWMWTWFDPAGPRSAAEVAASFVDTFLGGVLTDPGAAAALGDPAGTVARVVAEAVAAGREPGVDGGVGSTPG
jgi:TetR/AcrR family transcriptional regulator, cholesterol catabolism regulator